MAFYIAIIVFIASVIGGLVLVILNKRMDRARFLLYASLHLVLLFGFIASLILKKAENASIYNYFLLFFICSGVFLSGISWRSDLPRVIRYYFSLYLITVPLFLLSPSMLVNLLLTGKYTDSIGERFDLGNRYFLERQGAVMSNSSHPHYKIIRKKGMFHETLQRDITFNGKLDSVKVIQLEPGEFIEFRGYFSNSTYVSTEIDSADLSLPLKKKKRNEIEYRL